MRPQDLIGSDVFDPEGRRVGRVGAVLLDGDTREPAWVTVRTGLFGHRETYVPLAGAQVADEGIQVAVRKDVVKDAPKADGPLTTDAGAELTRFYGLPAAAVPVRFPRAPKPSDMPRRAPARYVVDAAQQVTKPT